MVPSNPMQAKVSRFANIESRFGSTLLQNLHNATGRSFASTVCSTYRIILMPLRSCRSQMLLCSVATCPALLFLTPMIMQGMPIASRLSFMHSISGKMLLIFSFSNETGGCWNCISSFSSSNLYVPSRHIFPPKPSLLQL